MAVQLVQVKVTAQVLAISSHLKAFVDNTAPTGSTAVLHCEQKLLAVHLYLLNTNPSQTFREYMPNCNNVVMINSSLRDFGLNSAE